MTDKWIPWPFDYETPPAARNSDPPTSHQAAARHPALRGLNRWAVLQAHADNPQGLNDFELSDQVGLAQTSCGKRRGELRDLGLIENSGTTRPAPSGSPAIVWRITAAGMELRSLKSNKRPIACR